MFGLNRTMIFSVPLRSPEHDKTQRTMNPSQIFRLALMVGSLVGPSPVSAQTTLLPSADARSRQQADPTSANAGDTNRLGVGPVNGSDDYFRSYLAFDLTNEESASVVILTLPSTNAPESNTASGFTQNFTLFQVASDWDGVSPPPNGTDLASHELTLDPVASSGMGLAFSSPALTAAFNDAIGSTLYLGVSSPEGEAAPPGTRSFLWLTSSESSIDDRGRDGALVCATPPSKPCVRISRTRLSSQHFTPLRRLRYSFRASSRL